MSRRSWGSTPRMTCWAWLTKLVELFAAADIQLAEPLEELGQVLDGRVAENFRLAVFLTGKPLREMRDQLGQFGGERLFGQPHGFIEPATAPARTPAHTTPG